LDGSRKPAIMCRIVDLPAPFGPEEAGDTGADVHRDVVDRHHVARTSG